MTAPAVAGLLLAAGGGARFGRPKALVEVAGERLVERGARLLRAAGLDPVVVVLGAAADRVRAEADLDGVEVVDNPAWESGMGSSLRTGLAALTDRAPAAIVALADQPGIGVTAVRRLVGAWAAGARVAVATYGGERRNPVLLHAAVWDAVASAATGDEGARPFLRAHPELVVPVGCDGTGYPDDVDTPEDLARIATAMESRGDPGCS